MVRDHEGAYLLCSKENQFSLPLFPFSVIFFLYFFLSQPLALNITDVPRLSQGTPLGPCTLSLQQTQLKSGGQDRL